MLVAFMYFRLTVSADIDRKCTFKRKLQNLYLSQKIIYEKRFVKFLLKLFSTGSFEIKTLTFKLFIDIQKIIRVPKSSCDP